MNTEPTDREITNLVHLLKAEVGVGADDLVFDINGFVKISEYNYEEGHLDDSFSAVSMSLGSGRYLIIYNLNHHWSEKFRRFTIAHELGHLTIPAHRAFLNDQGYHFSITEFSSDTMMERAADRFAINFLAPKQAFQKAMTPMGYTKDDIISLSDTFQISTYATAHRFVELAGDFACSLIACHRDGKIKYEVRSEGMRGLVKGHRSLNGLPINPSTLASEIIWGVHDTDSVQLSLSNWYQDLEIEIEAQETIIDLGYNQLYLALIEPLSVDLPNQDDEDLQDRLPSERWNESYKY